MLMTDEPLTVRNLPPPQGFGPIAVENSEDQASRYRGGVVGPFTAEGDYEEPIPTLRAAAATLTPGEFSAVIEMPPGLYAVRLIEKTDSQIKAFDAVKLGLHRTLLRQREEEVRTAFYEELRRRYPAKIDHARLKNMKTVTGKTPES